MEDKKEKKMSEDTLIGEKEKYKESDAKSDVTQENPQSKQKVQQEVKPEAEQKTISSSRQESIYFTPPDQNARVLSQAHEQRQPSLFSRFTTLGGLGDNTVAEYIERLQRMRELRDDLIKEKLKVDTQIETMEARIKFVKDKNLREKWLQELDDLKKKSVELGTAIQQVSEEHDKLYREGSNYLEREYEQSMERLRNSQLPHGFRLILGFFLTLGHMFNDVAFHGTMMVSHIVSGARRKWTADDLEKVKGYANQETRNIVDVVKSGNVESLKQLAQRVQATSRQYGVPADDQYNKELLEKINRLNEAGQKLMQNTGKNNIVDALQEVNKTMKELADSVEKNKDLNSKNDNSTEPEPDEGLTL